MNPAKAEVASRLKPDQQSRLKPDLIGSGRIKPPSKLAEPSRLSKAGSIATSSVKSSTKSTSSGLRKPNSVPKMTKNVQKIPSSAPEPPQRTTSRLSSERLPQRKEVPPELPKKSSRVQPAKEPTGQVGGLSKPVEKTEAVSRTKLRQKVPTATDKTVKPGSTAGNRSVETTRIRPPSFLPQKSTTGNRSGTQSEMVQPPTKLKFVSSSTRQTTSEKGQPVSTGPSRIPPVQPQPVQSQPSQRTQPVQPRPAPPPPPQESTTKVVEKLAEKVAEKTKPEIKPEIKPEVEMERRSTPISPPLPPQRTTSTSSVPTSLGDSTIQTPKNLEVSEKVEKVPEKKEKSKIASKERDNIIKCMNSFFFWGGGVSSFRKNPSCKEIPLKMQKRGDAFRGCL